MLATGEAPMSTITSDWAPFETEMPVTPPVESRKAYRREEEFRSALDRYIAGYVAEQQKRRTAETSDRNSYFTAVRRFASWKRSGYPFART
jgi:hypothetical protein